MIAHQTFYINKISFNILFDSKKLIFDSDVVGLEIDGVSYTTNQDGKLIYDKVKKLKKQKPPIK